jgi:hypothetical protein
VYGLGRCEIDEVAWERVSDVTAMLADSAGHAYSTPNKLKKLDSGICANRRVSYLRMRHGDCDTVRPRGRALPLFANPDCARIGIVSGMIGVDVRPGWGPHRRIGAKARTRLVRR